MARTIRPCMYEPFSDPGTRSLKPDPPTWPTRVYSVRPAGREKRRSMTDRIRSSTRNLPSSDIPTRKKVKTEKKKTLNLRATLSHMGPGTRICPIQWYSHRLSVSSCPTPRGFISLVTRSRLNVCAHLSAWAWAYLSYGESVIRSYILGFGQACRNRPTSEASDTITDKVRV